MLIQFLLLVSTSVSFLLAERPLNEFQIVEKNQFGPMMVDYNQIIHETENAWILKSSLTNFASYDYYFLQLTADSHSHPWFYENAKVVAEKPGEFLILEIRNEKQLMAVAAEAHRAGHNCGMMQKLFPEPIARAQIETPQLVDPQRADISAATSSVVGENILRIMETMVSWQTRFESEALGVDTGEKLKALYEELIPADRTDVEIELFSHQGSPQKSLIVRIHGQSKADEILILGSHIDSINQQDHSHSPGADDNASGTATNREIFRVLMEIGFKPERTIEIHGYAAEEIGLIGSQEIARDYKAKNKKVIAMVQFDMNAFANGSPKITFVTNGTNSGLTNQLQQLVKNYNQIPSATGYLLFGSSDHAAWAKQGFPVAFPTEDPFGFNRKIHTAGDTMANINSPQQIFEFAKLGVAYLMDFSD